VRAPRSPLAVCQSPQKVGSRQGRTLFEGRGPICCPSDWGKADPLPDAPLDSSGGSPLEHGAVGLPIGHQRRRMHPAWTSDNESSNPGSTLGGFHCLYLLKGPQYLQTGPVRPFKQCMDPSCFPFSLGSLNGAWEESRFPSPSCNTQIVEEAIKPAAAWSFSCGTGPCQLAAAESSCP